MKQKVKGIILCTLLCFTLAACSQQEGQGRPEAQEKAPTVQPVEEPVQLSFGRKRCSVADNQMEYTIANATGQRLGIYPVPRLERNTDTGWQTIPCHGGFCGVEDPLEGQWEGVLDLQWFAPLQPGEYRLTMTVTRQGEEWMQVQDTFWLEA